MSSKSKRASFDNSSPRNPPLRQRGSTQLVAPWEQENDVENFASSQFINFLDSKLRSADPRKKSSTPQGSFNVPVSANNLSRSNTIDESFAKGDVRPINRKRITERAAVRGNPASMSTTLSVVKKRSDRDESSIEEVNLAQKRLIAKKDNNGTGANSQRWGIMPQFQTRMRRGDQGRVPMVLNGTDIKQRSLYVKRPSTSTGGFVESEEKTSTDLSRTSKGGFAKLERFFAHTEGDHIAERYNKGTWDVDYYERSKEKSQVRNRKTLISRGSKNYEEENGAISGESNVREFVEVIRRHKPQLKSREKYDMSTEEIELGCIGKSIERKEDTVLGDFGMTKHTKNPLSYLFPVSIPKKPLYSDTNSVIQAQAIKMIMEAMPNKANTKKYEEDVEYNGIININQKTLEKDVSSKQVVASILVSGLPQDEATKPVKKMSNTLGFKGFKQVIHSPKTSGFSTTTQLNMTSDTLRPGTTKSKNGGHKYNESDIEQCIETVLDPETTEKRDIQGSINYTNRIWTSHKDRYGPDQTPLFRNLKKCLEERSQHAKTDTSTERNKGTRTSSRGFHPKTMIKSNRPETATNRDLINNMVTPKGDDNRFQGLSTKDHTKKYLAYKTVKPKESPIFQKSLDKIRAKANCDISKSIRIQNLSNVNVWEDEDLASKGVTSFDKLKAIINTSSVQAMYAPRRDNSGSNTSYQVKNISFQTAGAEQVKIPKRPKFKKKIE